MADRPRPSWTTWGKRTLGAAAAVSVIAGAVTGVQALINSVRPIIQPDSFQGDVSRLPTASDFIRFLTSKDGKVIHLDISCQEPLIGRSQCDARPDLQGADSGLYVLLAVYTRQAIPPADACGSLALTTVQHPPLPDCSGVFWLHFYVGPGINAQIANGTTGAGSTRFHGTFTTIVQGFLTDAPPTVQNISLAAANPTG